MPTNHKYKAFKCASINFLGGLGMRWQASGTVEGVGNCRTTFSCKQTGEVATYKRKFKKYWFSNLPIAQYRWILFPEGLLCLFHCLENA